jgi:hypothetical protein
MIAAATLVPSAATGIATGQPRFPHAGSTPVSPLRILAGYRYLFCTLLVIASAQALVTQGHEHAHAALLGAAEAIGALLLMGRGTQWPGA